MVWWEGVGCVVWWVGVGCGVVGGCREGITKVGTTHQEVLRSYL